MLPRPGASIGDRACFAPDSGALDMKTVKVDPSAFDIAQSWIAAHPVLTVAGAVAALFWFCLDWRTRRDLLAVLF